MAVDPVLQPKSMATTIKMTPESTIVPTIRPWLVVGVDIFIVVAMLQVQEDIMQILVVGMVAIEVPTEVEVGVRIIVLIPIPIFMND